jgi:hypothetical protein
MTRLQQNPADQTIRRRYRRYFRSNPFGEAALQLCLDCPESVGSVYHGRVTQRLLERFGRQKDYNASDVASQFQAAGLAKLYPLTDVRGAGLVIFFGTGIHHAANAANFSTHHQDSQIFLGPPDSPWTDVAVSGLVWVPNLQAELHSALGRLETRGALTKLPTQLLDKVLSRGDDQAPCLSARSCPSVR